MLQVSKDREITLCLNEPYITEFVTVHFATYIGSRYLQFIKTVYYLSIQTELEVILY